MKATTNEWLLTLLGFTLVVIGASTSSSTAWLVGGWLLGYLFRKSGER